MRKRWRMTAFILCMSLCMCACASKNEEEHKTEAEKKIENPSEIVEKEYQKKLDAIEPAAYGNVSGLELEAGSYISIIGKGRDGEYWKQVEAGARQAAADLNEELGYKGKDEVRVTYSGPAEADNVDEQVNILDEELARYPIGLSISIADTKACGVQFDLALDNGIPIVAFDSGSDYQGLMATVSTDNSGSAQTAAEKMAELMGESGEIIIFVQDSTSMSAMERENGFAEKIKADYPELSITQIYHMDQLDEVKEAMVKERYPQSMEENSTEENSTEEKSAEELKAEELAAEITVEEIMDYILEKNPQVKGIYGTDGTAVRAAAEAIARAERDDIIVIGYDGDEEELEALKDGRVKGLMIQNPFGMGYAAVVASARAALSMGNEAYVDTGVMWVTQENLESEAVKAWLY